MLIIIVSLSGWILVTELNNLEIYKFCNCPILVTEFCPSSAPCSLLYYNVKLLVFWPDLNCSSGYFFRTPLSINKLDCASVEIHWGSSCYLSLLKWLCKLDLNKVPKMSWMCSQAPANLHCSLLSIGHKVPVSPYSQSWNNTLTLIISFLLACADWTCHILNKALQNTEMEIKMV